MSRAEIQQVPRLVLPTGGQSCVPDSLAVGPWDIQSSACVLGQVLGSVVDRAMSRDSCGFRGLKAACLLVDGAVSPPS